MKRTLLLALPVLFVLAVWLRPRPAAVSPIASPIAQTPDPDPEPGFVPPETASGAFRFPKEDALHAAGQAPGEQHVVGLKTLRHLLKTQNEDGSWGRETDFLDGLAVDPVGATSLALLSFLGAGYTYLSSDEVEGRVIGQSFKKALQWLLDRQGTDGMIATSGDPVLAQALAALALSETFGMTGSNVIKDQTVRAVTALNSLQQPDGTWGCPVRSAWAAMGLCSASISEIPVERTFLERARTAATAEMDRAMSPKALASHLFLNREKGRPSVETAARWLSSLPPDWSQQDFSYWYFGSLALYQLDGPAGKTWKSWAPRLNETLLNSRDKSGSWPGTTSTGTVIRTSLGTLTLEVFFRYGNILAAK